MRGAAGTLLTDGAQLTLQVDAGATSVDVALTLHNSALPSFAAPLQVKRVTVLSLFPAANRVPPPAVACSLDGADCSKPAARSLIAPGANACGATATSLALALHLTLPAVATPIPRRLQLRIELEGDPTLAGGIYVADLFVTPGLGHASCPTAGLHSLGQAPTGGSASRTLVCANTGKGPLLLLGATAASQAPEAWRFAVMGASATPAAAWSADPPPVIEPGATFSVDAHLVAAPSSAPVFATLRLLTNDTSLPGGVLVLDFAANDEGPCLTLTPSLLSIDGALVGVAKAASALLRSCGKAPVAITAVTLAGDDGLSLDFATGGFTADNAPTAAAPEVLAPGGEASVGVVCTAAQAGTAEATLRVETADGAAHTANIRCVAAAVACPIACIQTQAPAQVAVGEPVALDSACSAAGGGGKLLAWKWQLSGPGGAQAALQPSANSPAVQWIPALPLGAWTASLVVEDGYGTSSASAACGGQPASRAFEVVPAYDLHVELAWGWAAAAAAPSLHLHVADLDRIPADAPDHDADGAPDPWYAPCADAFFLAKAPPWGDLQDIADDPLWSEVVAGDTQRESVGVDVPAIGARLRVGVYRWPTPTTAAVAPRLQVRAYGALIYDAALPTLVGKDLHCAVELEWLGGGAPPKLKPCAGAAMTPNYPLPPTDGSFACP